MSTLTSPARDGLQDAKLEAADGPEGEVAAAAVAAHGIQLSNASQVPVHDRGAADEAAGGVDGEHEDEQHHKDDACAQQDIR